MIVGVDPDPANADLISQWAKDYWTALHPTSAGGGYVNMMMDGGRGPDPGGVPGQLPAAGRG